MKYLKSTSIFDVSAMLLIGLGAFLRIYGLTFQSLSNDELSSLFRSSHGSIIEVIKYGVLNEFHPPGYHILLYYIINWFGNYEEILRFPSAIAGVISIYGMYRLGSLVYTKHESLLATGFLTVLFIPLHFSQMARSYIFLLMASIFSTIYFFKLVIPQEKAKRRDMLLYVFFALLGSYFHYCGAALTLFQCFVGTLILVYQRLRPWRYLIAHMLILIFYLPCIYLLAHQFTNISSHNVVLKKGPIIFYEFLKRLFNYSDAVTILIITVISVWLARYLISIFIRKRFYRDMNIKTLILLSHALAPILFVFFVSTFLKPFFHSRYLHVSMPSIYLLVSYIIINTFKGNAYKFVITFIIIFSLGYQLIGIKGYYRWPRDAQFREAAYFLVSNYDKHHNLPIIGFAYSLNYFHYYFDRFKFEKRISFLAGEDSDIKKLDDYLKNNIIKSFWFIRGHRSVSINFLNYIKNNFNIVKVGLFVGAEAFLIQRK